MKKGIKKYIVALATIASLFSINTIYAQSVNMTLVYDGKSHNYSAEEVRIEVDGSELTNLDVPPIIINDRTMMPARAIFEKLGGEVTWNNDTQEVYIIKDNDLIVLKIDSNIGYKNGFEFTMDTTAKIVNDRTMIPVRAATEALGCTVGWDEITRFVSVNSSSYTPPSPTGNGETQSGGSSSGEITGATINVTGVTVPSSNTATQVFSINTSGAIEKYECFMLDTDRLVIDIYNANNAITNSSITNTNSTIVTSVRSGQNQIDPVKVTRVVLDLSVPQKYTANLSSDKKTISISFESNKITDLTSKNSGNTDSITIYGSTMPIANVFTLSNPNRLVIDIPNSISNLDSTYSSDLDFVDDIRVGAPTEGTTRIVLDLNRYINFSVKENSDSITVMIEKSTFDNMIFDHDSSSLILQNPDGLSSSDFTVTDNYLKGQYILTLPGDFKSTYGYGTIPINQGYIDSIEIKNNGNNTQIVVNENSIIATKISADSDEVTIKFVSPREVYDNVVVIDAGHGATDPGASANGLTEKDVNLDIMLRVYALLLTDSRVTVYATRVDDTYPTNMARAQMGNSAADLFVSIHQNSASSSAGGTEVLYSVHSTDVNGKLTSKIAAQFMQNYIVKAVGTTDRGIKNRPDLIVLNQTEIPAILIETAFLTNGSDVAMLKSEEQKDKIAEAMYSAIVDMLMQY